MNSALYEGIVLHHRHHPKKHKFTYKLFMSYLDLDELGHIFNNIPFCSDNGKKNIAYFNRADYLTPTNIPLKKSIKDIIYKKTGTQHLGPIRMLTHLRILGYCFNPVTIYYCFDKNGTELEYIIADVTNTPWNEKHQYFINFKTKKNTPFAKSFHISPFMGMDMEYDWLFSIPEEKLSINMLANKQDCYFRAYMNLTRIPITKKNISLMLIKYSFINYKIIWGIYWQAAKLYIKNIPFHPHPKTKSND